VEGARAPSSGLRPCLRAHPRGFRGGSPGKRPGSGLPALTALSVPGPSPGSRETPG
jgi:hypothetical protein